MLVLHYNYSNSEYIRTFCLLATCSCQELNIQKNSILSKHLHGN